MAAVSCRPSWPVRVGFDRRACAPASRGYSSVAGEASASTMLGFSSSLPSLCYDGASSANGRREELMYRFVAWFSPLWVAALLCGGRRLLRCLPLGCWWVDLLVIFVVNNRARRICGHRSSGCFLCGAFLRIRRRLQPWGAGPRGPLGIDDFPSVKETVEKKSLPAQVWSGGGGGGAPSTHSRRRRWWTAQGPAYIFLLFQGCPVRWSYFNILSHGLCRKKKCLHGYQNFLIFLNHL